eukprot:6402941-Lingulodinium_polyedra.AAC.1
MHFGLGARLPEKRSQREDLVLPVVVLVRVEAPIERVDEFRPRASVLPVSVDNGLRVLAPPPASTLLWHGRNASPTMHVTPVAWPGVVVGTTNVALAATFWRAGGLRYPS